MAKTLLSWGKVKMASNSGKKPQNPERKKSRPIYERRKNRFLAFFFTGNRKIFYLNGDIFSISTWSTLRNILEEKRKKLGSSKEEN